MTLTLWDTEPDRPEKNGSDDDIETIIAYVESKKPSQGEKRIWRLPEYFALLLRRRLESEKKE